MTVTAPPPPSFKLGQAVETPRTDRHVITSVITMGRCSACSGKYSSERMQVGMKHKACPVSPKGRFVRNS